jgi:hypothetical protein
MVQENLLKETTDLPTPLVSSLFAFASAERNPIRRKFKEKTSS